MCALFRTGVKLRSADVIFENPALREEVVVFTTRVLRSEPLTASLLQADLSFSAPTFLQAPIEVSNVVIKLGPALDVAAAKVTTRALDGKSFVLTTRLNDWEAIAPPKVLKDLAFMRTRPVLRKGVPARLVPPEALAYWTKRLADSRRLPVAQIQIEMVFPDLPLQGGEAVHYRPEERAISFLLPATPVQPSTVVIARHARTGEVLQGRFYREAT